MQNDTAVLEHAADELVSQTDLTREQAVEVLYKMAALLERLERGQLVR